VVLPVAVLPKQQPNGQAAQITRHAGTPFITCGFCLMLQVVTYTSDLRGASTDAGVYIELFDTAGASSGCKQLLLAASDAFERGKADEFTITCHALGRLTKLRVGHDSKGARPAWHLAKVGCVLYASGSWLVCLSLCWRLVFACALLLRLCSVRRRCDRCAAAAKFHTMHGSITW
jgi:hypothetical protein